MKRSGEPVGHAVALGACPFCGLALAATCDVDELPDLPTGLAHEEPACATFRDLDPLAFAIKANEARARGVRA